MDKCNLGWTTIQGLLLKLLKTKYTLTAAIALQHSWDWEFFYTSDIINSAYWSSSLSIHLSIFVLNCSEGTSATTQVLTCQHSCLSDSIQPAGQWLQCRWQQKHQHTQLGSPVQVCLLLQQFFKFLKTCKKYWQYLLIMIFFLKVSMYAFGKLQHSFFKKEISLNQTRY